MWILGLVLDAALLGIIIAIVSKDAFPGWGPAIGCAFATGVATSVVTLLLPRGFWPVGVLVGAGVGALVISWLCQLDLRRSMIAAGIYLGASLALHGLSLLLF